MGAGVIGNNDYHSAVDAREMECGQKIQGHVQTVCLHHRKRPYARKRPCGGYFQRDLLVDGPFRIDAALMTHGSQTFKDLYRG